MRGRKRRQADPSSGEKSSDAEETAVALTEDAGPTSDGPEEEQKASTGSIQSAHDAAGPGPTEEPGSGDVPAGEPAASTKASEQATAGRTKEEQIDLDALARELERSLGGRSDDPSNAPPPPPEINATPEEILGVPTQRAAFEREEEKRPKPEPEHRVGAEVLKTGGGPPPMDEYEERAQMAKEVLRATSDQPRSVRRQPKPESEGSDAEDVEADEPAPVNDESVRFSEDMTISSRSSRKRRKLFGR